MNRTISCELSVIVLLNNAAISSSIRILDFNCGFLVLVMILSFFAKLLCASTMDPSGNEDINMFQVLLSGDGDTDHTYRYDSDKLEQMFIMA